MKIKDLLKANTLGSLLFHAGLAVALVLTLGVSYFFVYLPNTTGHGQTVVVPDLSGKPADSLDLYLSEYKLRFEVQDSSYAEEYPALTVIRQFPHAGSVVKEGRKIFITINRITPPTVPVPDLVTEASSSLINAEAVLKSNELRRGHIILMQSPFSNLVIEMRINGNKVEPGMRVPKGTVIDLVVGDGTGPKDFVVRNLIGQTYQHALVLLSNWNLHLGDISIPEDVDTTGLELFVFKQKPLPGDSVRVGEPVHLWLGPQGYEEKDAEEDEDLH
ncbi:MAG: PASTA domain-containing protein [Cyclobacteriaceae bacterium]|nr:PASTA domain-containing protein [Cyclobacteriaceae bacterium]